MRVTKDVGGIIEPCAGIDLSIGEHWSFRLAPIEPCRDGLAVLEGDLWRDRDIDGIGLACRLLVMCSALSARARPRRNSLASSLSPEPLASPRASIFRPPCP